MDSDMPQRTDALPSSPILVFVSPSLLNPLHLLPQAEAAQPHLQLTCIHTLTDIKAATAGTDSLHQHILILLLFLSLPFHNQDLCRFTRHFPHTELMLSSSRNIPAVPNLTLSSLKLSTDSPSQHPPAHGLFAVLAPDSFPPADVSSGC